MFMESIRCAGGILYSLVKFHLASSRRCGAMKDQWVLHDSPRNLTSNDKFSHALLWASYEIYAVVIPHLSIERSPIYCISIYLPLNQSAVCLTYASRCLPTSIQRGHVCLTYVINSSPWTQSWWNKSSDAGRAVSASSSSHLSSPKIQPWSGRWYARIL